MLAWDESTLPGERCSVTQFALRIWSYGSRLHHTQPGRCLEIQLIHINLCRRSRVNILCCNAVWTGRSGSQQREQVKRKWWISIMQQQHAPASYTAILVCCILLERKEIRSSTHACVSRIDQTSTFSCYQAVLSQLHLARTPTRLSTPLFSLKTTGVLFLKDTEMRLVPVALRGERSFSLGSLWTATIPKTAVHWRAKENSPEHSGASSTTSAQPSHSQTPRSWTDTKKLWAGKLARRLATDSFRWGRDRKRADGLRERGWLYEV